MRSFLRAAVTGAVVGAVGLGSAWGAAVLTTPALPAVPAPPTSVVAPPAAGAAAQEQAPAATAAAVAPGERLPAGWWLAGSATTSLVPPADRWKQAAECRGSSPEQLYTPLTPDGCLITFDMLWADGVDSDNPIQARSVALSNGVDTVVFTVMDVVGYMASYPADLCADCGIGQVTQALSTELGIPARNLVVQASHTHAAPSTIAKGAPWYYQYVRDQLKASVRGAVADLRTSPPVRLETGATAAKAYNVDRRIADRAVPDFELGWLRAFVPGQGAGKGTTRAVLGSFAVHPTVRNANARLHSGMVGPFTRRLSQELGGAALFLPGAIGDQTPDKGFGINGLGEGLADLVVEDVRRGGTVLQSNDVEVAATTVQVPVENAFFAGALASGYAVRDILPPYGGGPHAVSTRANGGRLPNCVGAGSTHVVTPVSAVRLGARPAPGKVETGRPEDRRPVPTDNVVLVQTPGEVFASIGLVVKDYLSRSSNVLVQGLTNDTIGYIIPANQYDLFASQGGGLVGNAAGTSNYEEALSLGRCTGELVTTAALQMGAQLGVMGEGEAP
ncbi:MAG TPA: hypothetical protein VNU66_13285 [Mycobacteriales bacterium]|nr:hypothetical protein [Mycobacteriales bacterium]